MVSRTRALVVQFAAVAAVALCSCHAFTPNIFAVADGPKLTVLQPSNVTGGQTAHWSFAWTKGAGAPYMLYVIARSGRIQNGIFIANGDVAPVEWTQAGISVLSQNHDLVLPNSGSSVLTYAVEATLTDKAGPGGFGGFIPSYNGSDSVDLYVDVAPGG